MRTVIKFPCAVPLKLPFLLKDTLLCLIALIFLVNLFGLEHVPRLVYFSILMRSQDKRPASVIPSKRFSASLKRQVLSICNACSIPGAFRSKWRSSPLPHSKANHSNGAEGLTRLSETRKACQQFEEWQTACFWSTSKCHLSNSLNLLKTSNEMDLHGPGLPPRQSSSISTDPFSHSEFPVHIPKCNLHVKPGQTNVTPCDQSTQMLFVHHNYYPQKIDTLKRKLFIPRQVKRHQE